MPEGGSQITFPPDFDYKGVEKFKGINTKSKRPAIDDEEFSWLENLMPVGDGNLRAMYDKGTALYTAPGGKTIVFFEQFNIGTTDYIFVCLSDGTAVAVALIGGAQTNISSTPNTFYNGGNLPAITQYGASGILIVTTASSNGYYSWDGTLTSPGSSAPTWLSGLAANIVANGSSNSNTTLTGFASTVGIVVGMLVTGTDIPANTFVTGGTSTTVTISNAATGSHAGVNFTFSWQMPTGIQGTGISTYQNRVFVVNGPVWDMSAASNGAYFAAANGGSITTSTDPNLRHGYVAAQAANGYQYLIADSSIWNISNVTQTVTNNVATATAQYSNSDSQTGSSWPNSVVAFGRAVILANVNGIYDLLGNSATKISDALDGLFATLDTSVVTPTSAVCTLYGIRVLVVCFKAKDYLGTNRTMLACFDGKKWWMASQTVVPTFISTVEVNSLLTAYGTDGNTIFPLFQTPSNTLLKTLQSKLYGGKYGYLSIKNALRYYLQLDPLANNQIAPTVTVDSETSSQPVQGSLAGFLVFTNALGQAIQFQNSSLQNIFWTLNGLINVVEAPNAGNLLGFTFQSMSSDFVIERSGIGYQDQSPNF